MNLFTLQYLIKCYFLFAILLMTFQILSILVSRIKYGKAFKAITSKIPLSHGDTSQVLFIQYKGTMPITGSLLIMTIILTLILLKKQLLPIDGVKDGAGLISFFILSIAIPVVLLAYQHCFCILTEQSLYINTVRTRFATTIIPIDNIVRCEHRELRNSDSVIVITQNKQYEISHVANWQELIDSFNKLKSRKDSKQTESTTGARAQPFRG